MIGGTFQGFGEFRRRKHLICIGCAGIAHTGIIGEDRVGKGFYVDKAPEILIQNITILFQFTGRELLYVGDSGTVISLNGPVTMAAVCADNPVLIMELDFKDAGSWITR